jgi:hypothetical protein
MSAVDRRLRRTTKMLVFSVISVFSPNFIQNVPGENPFAFQIICNNNNNNNYTARA